MKLYSYYDYEEAYYNCDVYACKEIGCYLLSQMKDERSRDLYNKLNIIKYVYGDKDPEVAKLLSDVKCWLMVNC